MRRIKKSTVQTLAVAAAVVCVLTAAFVAAYQYNVKEMQLAFEEEREVFRAELGRNQRNYYKAAEDIEPGELLSEDNTVAESGYASMDAGLLLTGEELGCPARVGIRAGTILTKDMAAEGAVPEGLREHEFGCIYLSSNLGDGDTVDVRLMFPNGENYIVLSKKELHGVTLGLNNCFLWMDEKEALLMSSAVVDAYLHSGAVLYTAKYIEAALQEESVPTYIPNRDVMELIQANPNILAEAKEGLSAKLREELEGRLQEEDAMEAGEDPYPALLEEEKETLGQYLHGQGTQKKEAGLDGDVQPDAGGAEVPAGTGEEARDD